MKITTEAIKRSYDVETTTSVKKEFGEFDESQKSTKRRLTFEVDVVEKKFGDSTSSSTATAANSV
jgi:hypothetical protein